MPAQAKAKTMGTWPLEEGILNAVKGERDKFFVVHLDIPGTRRASVCIDEEGADILLIIAPWPHSNKVHVEEIE